MILFCTSCLHSPAMVLTAILTAISDLLGLFATVRTHPDSLTGKEFRTSVNFSGRAADDWGSRGREFKSRQPDQTDERHPT